MSVERIEVIALTPDEIALDDALTQCGIDDDRRCGIADRLVNLPYTLLDQMYYRRGLLVDPSECFRYRLDNDTLAQILALNETPNEAPAAWPDLERGEKARAKCLGEYFVSHKNTSAFPQGRPHAVDPAVVLYCAHTLMEATGKPSFPISRPNDEKAGPRKPGGPMFRALMAALEIHAMRERGISTLLGPIGREDCPPAPQAETVVTILRSMNSKKFTEWAATFGLALTGDSVACFPAAFRHLLGLTQKILRK